MSQALQHPKSARAVSSGETSSVRKYDNDDLNLSVVD